MEIGEMLGKVGLWTFQLDLQPAAVAREAAAELEELGYPTLWIPEAVGREVLTNAAVLLGATERLNVATGIASIWARDAMATAAGQRTLCEAFGGRFLLGLGVSHRPMVEGMRGAVYDRPLERMRSFLDAMDSAFSMSPAPTDPPRRVLAALGPRMLALAAEKALGAHPYFVPVEHTLVAREALGSEPMLLPEQAAVLSTDAEVARSTARTHMATYLGLPNYTNNLRRLGWTDEDLSGGGSDRLVDAIVAWGDVDAIVDRVRAHHEAGADHVCVQVLTPDRTDLPLEPWRRLAPALLSL
jgi:probable F420-dependent oxidoreductase